LRGLRLHWNHSQVVYMITFVCCGCHLHGHESGSVDRGHNLSRSPLIGADPKRVLAEMQRMSQPPYGMDHRRREAVLPAMMVRCPHQGWSLRAAQVRTNHVHIVVEADALPEGIMIDLKAYASRCLNRLELDEPGRKRWARHGSTRWLKNPLSVSPAIRYVVDQQGSPMAVFEATEE
jgi:hypothetical protein